MTTKKEAELIRKRDKIYKQAEPINKELSEIKDKRARKDWEKMVGKCFKFRNSFGSGEKWWLYEKIVGFNEDGLITLIAQKDSHDHIEIEKRTSYGYHHSGDIKISKEEFDREFQKLLSEILALTK